MADGAVSRIDIDVRSSGVDKAIASLEKLVSAEGSAQVSTDKLAKVRERSETAVDRLAKRYDAEYKVLQQVRRDQEALNRAYDAGLGGTKAYELALAGLQKQQKLLSVGANDNAKSVGLARHEWINLSRQLQDVGVSLAGGASPFMVLTQQGGQIADVFSSSRGGAGAALREFGSAALRFAVHPVTLAAAAAGGATLAYMRWREQVDALTVSLNGLGRQSGLSQFGVNRAAEAGAARAEISNSAARGLAGQFLGAGVPGANIEGAIGISGRFSRSLGLSLEDAGKELASALAAPAKGADELAKKYGLVTFSEREHIKQIAAVGDKSGASAKLLAILSQRIAEMEDPTSRLAKLWERVKGGFFNGLDKFGQFIDRAIDGPEEIARRQREQARRALQGALSGRENEEAERAKQLNQLREDSAFAVREIQARTFAEREAIATERARVTVLRETYDAEKAAMAAEAERAKMLAESARKVEDLVRSSEDQGRLARASNPLERRLMEIEFARRDFFRENIPGGATPMAREFDTAGAAARNLATALEGAAGRIDGRIGRLVPISEWQGGAGASAGDPRGMAGFIQSEARRLGIDPETALRVARSEGLQTFSGDQGTSGGAFQLHRGGIVRGGNGVSGLGDDFMRRTGLDPLDPANERSTITFALETARRVGWGPWHGAARAGIGRFEGIGAAPANDNLGARADRMGFARQNDTAEYEARIKPQEDFAKSVILGRDALRARAETLGMDQRAVDEATKRQELMNEAIRQTGSILPEQKRWIEENSAAWADYQAEIRKVAEEEKQRKENLDIARSGVSGAFSGTLRAAANGENIGQALEQSLTRVRDNIFDTISNRFTEGLLGKMGSADGGLLGGLLGLGGGQNVASANIQAGVVNVNGAIGGVGGASGGGGLIGGLANWIGGLFGHNADGTDNWRGGLTWVGERGPELVNLPRGSQVVPNLDSVRMAQAMARSANSRGGVVAAPVTVNLIGAPAGAKVEQTTDSRGGRRIDVVFDERIAAAQASPQGVATSRALYGLKPQIARR